MEPSTSNAGNTVESLCMRVESPVKVQFRQRWLTLSSLDRCVYLLDRDGRVI